MGQNLATTSSDNTVTCSDCGLVYALSYRSFPMREEIILKCKCGNVVHEHNSSRHHTIRLFEEQNAKRSLDEEQSS